MKFKISELGNRVVLKTFKNNNCTRAVIIKEKEALKVIRNIRLNGWNVTLESPVKSGALMEAVC